MRKGFFRAPKTARPFGLPRRIALGLNPPAIRPGFLAADSALRHLFLEIPCIVTGPIPAGALRESPHWRGPFGCRAGATASATTAACCSSTCATTTASHKWWADPDSPAFKDAERLRSEWVVRIDGKVRRRPEGTDNPELPTGMVEIYVSEIEVLGPAAELPLPVFGEQEYPEGHKA